MKSLISNTFLAVIFMSGGVIQAATVVDFEDWSADPDYPYAVRSHGYLFAGYFSVSPTPGTGNPTKALHSLGPGAKMMAIDGNTFAISSLDLQEGIGISDTVSVMLLAFSLHGQLLQTFNLDGTLATFETVYPVGFSDLTEVHFYAYDAQGQATAGLFSVDNIVVPEPAALLLLSFGLIVVTRKVN